MTDWTDLYCSLLGQEVAGIVWMPITADTLHVAAELQSFSFSFSGAAHVRFKNEAFVLLSWQGKNNLFVLVEGNAAVWAPHSLDRLQVQGDAWFDILGSTLTTVELFASSMIRTATLSL